MIPDPAKRTVRIPVQWIDGRWQLFGGGKLPDLKQNAFADLMLPAVYLADKEQFDSWTRECVVELLKAGTELFARVNIGNVPDDLVKLTEKRETDDVRGMSSFVTIELQEDVGLSLTLGKRGRLVGGECVIPCWGNEKSLSINEAYTKVLRTFEPNRRSDRGKVFSDVFVQRGQRLENLDTLRNRATDAEAMLSARPVDRSETWCELATTLSSVYEVWRTSPESTRVIRRSIPLPEKTTVELAQAGQAYYDFRRNLMFQLNQGLLSLYGMLHDPSNESDEIKKFRNLQEAMNCAVLRAYGWDDLANVAKPDFFPTVDQDSKDDEGSKSNQQASMRLRWPDDFRDLVRSRLVKLYEQRVRDAPATHQRNLFLGDT